MRGDTLYYLASLIAGGGTVFAKGHACYKPTVETPSTFVTESYSTFFEPSTTSYPPSEPTYTPPVDTSSSISSSESTPFPEPTPSAGCRPTTDRWINQDKAPSVGTLRAAAIFIDFPDVPANTTAEELFYEYIEPSPRERFYEMSYGRLTLEVVPQFKFYRMPADSSSYDYSTLTWEAHSKYIRDALAAVDPAVSFAGIDALYVIPTKGANKIDRSTSTSADFTANDGSVITASITYGQDLYNTWGNKTINHETGHAMGLPDLYPYTVGTTEQWVGGFDMMGLIGGQSPDFFGWHKWQLGWIDETQVDCVQAAAGKTIHQISPIEVPGETTKLVAVPVNSTGYVLAEVRSNAGIDQGACGTGLLLYTADAAVSSGDGPVRVIDTKPGSGGCDFAHGGELNDSPLAVGESFDTGLGVVFTVTGVEGEDYVVEIERQ